MTQQATSKSFDDSFPSFECLPSERDVARKIADRAMADLGIARRNDPFTLIDVLMDVVATHCNGNPLRLEALLAADDFNFAHDILGIRTHLNRETGKLEDHFRPRFSQPRSALFKASEPRI
jgi:hypothetical protein